MNTTPDAAKCDALCEILHKISLQFEAGSDEYSALEAGAAALQYQFIRDTGKAFDDFLRKIKDTAPVTDKSLSDWLTKHPAASPGTTAVIGGMHHVVTAGLDGQLRLVRINPLD